MTMLISSAVCPERFGARNHQKKTRLFTRRDSIGLMNKRGFADRLA
jgi:hypothetical protein